MLNGDLNRTQVAAASVARAYRQSEELDGLRLRKDVIESVIDLYLKLNFPEAFEELERVRYREQVQEKKPDQELVAENMNDMLEQMMQAAGMSPLPDGW